MVCQEHRRIAPLRVSWNRSAPCAGTAPTRPSIAKTNRPNTGTGSSMGRLENALRCRMAAVRSWTFCCPETCSDSIQAPDTTARSNASYRTRRCCGTGVRKWNRSWSPIRTCRVEYARSRSTRSIECSRERFSWATPRALERVCGFLVEMSRRAQIESGGAVALPMSRYDIADYLAIAVETVSRCLTALRSNQVISFCDARHFRIINRKALEAHCCR